jgi:imidazolonepropionase-like amidohydrolase
MTLEEGPKIERALSKLMQLLDQEVPRALLKTRFSELDTHVVEEAEQYLTKLGVHAVQVHTGGAREGIENALRESLEAVDHLMHRAE